MLRLTDIRYLFVFKSQHRHKLTDFCIYCRQYLPIDVIPVRSHFHTADQLGDIIIPPEIIVLTLVTCDAMSLIIRMGLLIQ